MADQQSTIGEFVKTVTADALADGLKPPFVICLVSPDGAVLAVRSYQDREPEVLVNHAGVMLQAYKALAYCSIKAVKNEAGRCGSHSRIRTPWPIVATSGRWSVDDVIIAYIRHTQRKIVVQILALEQGVVASMGNVADDLKARAKRFGILRP